MIDKKKFFDAVRPSVFGGRIVQSQVVTLDALIDEWDRRAALKEVSVVAQLAYLMATVLRECGLPMAPVRETFASSDYQARRNLAGAWYARTDPQTGQAYYGRGLVQLTHRSNYRTMSLLLNKELAKKNSPWAPLVRLPLDLELEPDRALEMPVATWVLFEGCLNADSHVGDFTGVSLDDFINAKKVDFLNARRAVNGTDHAQEIADNAVKFNAALQKAA